MRTLRILLVFGIFWGSFGASLDDLVQAIRITESGGEVNYGDSAKNTNSSARGPLMITKNCWIDSIQHDPSIGGKFEDCDHLEYSKKIFLSYIDRYAKGKDAKFISKLWSNGPNGINKPAAEVYWQKVKKILEQK